MGYLLRLQTTEPEETWSNLLASGLQRLQEADVLKHVIPRTAGHLYLAGYIAEVALKVGYYRLIGLSNNQDVTPAFYKAKTWLKKHGHANAHSLMGWFRLTCVERTFQGKQWSAAQRGAFLAEIRLASAHWDERLRYRHTAPLTQESDELRNAAVWILKKRNLLWR